MRTNFLFIILEGQRVNALRNLEKDFKSFPVLKWSSSKDDIYFTDQSCIERPFQTLCRLLWKENLREKNGCQNEHEGTIKTTENKNSNNPAKKEPGL